VCLSNCSQDSFLVEYMKNMKTYLLCIDGVEKNYKTFVISYGFGLDGITA